MGGIAFAAPAWLGLAAAGFAGALLMAWAGRRRATTIRSFGREGVTASSWRAALFALVVAGLALAAARPQWGKAEATLPRRAVDVVYVVDVSRSMGASDVAPTRLAAAKEAIASSFLELRDVRVGLVVFAGTARVRFPLTTDVGAAAAIVRMLEPGQMIVGPGTSVAAGIDEAVGLFPPDAAAGRLVVIVSDGDDLGPAPVEALARLRASGADLLVVGVGTPEGAPVPVYDRQRGEWTLLRQADGTPVISRLDEGFLRSVAEFGGGRYVGSDLSLLPGAVRGRVAGLHAAQVESRTVQVPIERFHLFAGGSLALLVAGWFAEAVWRRWRKVLLAAAAVSALLVLGGCASQAHRLNEEGRDAYAAGDFEQAAERFREALAADPTNDQLALNLAAALHAAGRYDDAALAARRAASSPDPRIRALAHRFLGHHAFAQGRLEEALEELRQSLLEGPTADARHDYEVVYALLHGNREPQPPTPSPTATPAPPTPGQGGTPSPPQGDGATPMPGGGSPQPGGQGTPQPGGQTGPGSDRPPSDAQLADRIAAIDREVAAILDAAAGQLSPGDVERILDLLAERERLSALRGILSGAADPNDY